VHDLDLRVTHNGNRLYSNFGAAASGTYAGEEDTQNNVEKTTLASSVLSVGDSIIINVTTDNGLAAYNSQKFALVVTGNLEFQFTIHPTLSPTREDNIPTQNPALAPALEDNIPTQSPALPPTPKDTTPTQNPTLGAGAYSRGYHPDSKSNAGAYFQRYIYGVSFSRYDHYSTHNLQPTKRHLKEHNRFDCWRGLEF